MKTNFTDVAIGLLIAVLAGCDTYLAVHSTSTAYSIVYGLIALAMFSVGTWFVHLGLRGRTA